LNDRVNDYAFMTAEFQIGTFVISLMNAQLMADSTLAIYHNHILNNHNYPNKYFVAHQFTWQPAHQVNIYAGETLIYGNTAFNFNYLLPQGYHRVIADSDHDRDNATMYAGFDWHLHDRWLFYFTFMMDEFRPEKLLHDWWGNKYAGQGGVSYLWPYQLAENKRIRTTFEATAVRPWTYTHNLMYDKYTQDNHCLGFPFGANLIHFAGRLDVPLPWDCSYTSYASFMRQGVSTIPGQDNVGYSYLTNYGTYFDTFNELYDSTAQ